MATNWCICITLESEILRMSGYRKNSGGKSPTKRTWLSRSSITPSFFLVKDCLQRAHRLPSSFYSTLTQWQDKSSNDTLIPKACMGLCLAVSNFSRTATDSSAGAANVAFHNTLKTTSFSSTGKSPTRWCPPGAIVHSRHLGLHVQPRGQICTLTPGNATGRRACTPAGMARPMSAHGDSTAVLARTGPLKKWLWRSRMASRPEPWLRPSPLMLTSRHCMRTDRCSDDQRRWRRRCQSRIGGPSAANSVAIRTMTGPGLAVCDPAVMSPVPSRSEECLHSLCWRRRVTCIAGNLKYPSIITPARRFLPTL